MVLFRVIVRGCEISEYFQLHSEYFLIEIFLSPEYYSGSFPTRFCDLSFSGYLIGCYETKQNTGPDDEGLRQQRPTTSAPNTSSAFRFQDAQDNPTGGGGVFRKEGNFAGGRLSANVTAGE